MYFVCFLKVIDVVPIQDKCYDYTMLKYNQNCEFGSCFALCKITHLK